MMYYEPHPAQANADGICTVCNLTIAECTIDNPRRIAGQGINPLPQLLTFANETAYQRGARVLLFVNETGCTASLSDRDLEFADHAYPMLIGARDILPIAVDRLSAARTQILGALAFRRTLDAQAPWPNAIVDVPPADDGQKVRIEPQPFNRPPSGQKVEIAF